MRENEREREKDKDTERQREGEGEGEGEGDRGRERDSPLMNEEHTTTVTRKYNTARQRQGVDEVLSTFRQSLAVKTRDMKSEREKNEILPISNKGQRKKAPRSR